MQWVRSGEIFARDAWLGHRADVVVSELSHGEQRELELAVALATKPQLLLLDEPMAGLGITESARMVKLLQELRREFTIILVEHDMDVVASADWVIDLGPSGGNAGGLVVAAGTPADVVQVAESRTAPYLARRLRATADAS